MLPSKILIPLNENEVAPRFDLATEVLIVTCRSSGISKNRRIVALARPSAEQVCKLATTEDIDVVICGAIEETYYQYLLWKRIEVIDSVIGSSSAALRRFAAGSLQPGAIL